MTADKVDCGGEGGAALTGRGVILPIVDAADELVCAVRGAEVEEEGRLCETVVVVPQPARGFELRVDEYCVQEGRAAAVNWLVQFVLVGRRIEAEDDGEGDALE